MPFHQGDFKIQLLSPLSFAIKTENTYQRVLVSPEFPNDPLLIDLLPDAAQPTNDGQADGMLDNRSELSSRNL
jgi:hypothetical protein